MRSSVFIPKQQADRLEKPKEGRAFADRLGAAPIASNQASMFSGKQRREENITGKKVVALTTGEGLAKTNKLFNDLHKAFKTMKKRIELQADGEEKVAKLNKVENNMDDILANKLVELCRAYEKGENTVKPSATAHNIS